MRGMSILLSLGAGWSISPLDRGVTMRALQTPIWWPLHWIGTLVCLFPEVGSERVSWRWYELILCHGRWMADNALGLVTMP